MARAIVLLPWAAYRHLAKPQFHDRGAPDLTRLARRQCDLVLPCHRETVCCRKQRAAAGQPAIIHSPHQQIETGLRHAGGMGY